MATTFVSDPSTISSPGTEMSPLEPESTERPIGSTPDEHSVKAPNLIEALSSISTTSKLGEEAYNYVENLKKIFKIDHKDSIVVNQTSSKKCEVISIVDNDSPIHAGLNLVFSESYSTFDDTPPAIVAGEMKNFIENKFGQSKILQTIVVSPNDYKKSKHMAAFIENYFNVEHSKAGKININSLKGFKLTVITNIETVRKFVDEHSPHGVRARDDIGVLLAIEETSIDPATGQRTPDYTPFLAITGYTRIMQPQTMQGVKFVPVAIITDIVCSMPYRGLVSMALPLAADAFIVKCLWQQPYKYLNKEAPNLGNLYVDPQSHKPMPCRTIEDVRAFIANYLNNPLLAIDITEGRARMLGIDKILEDPAGFIRDMARFMNAEDALPMWTNMNADPIIYKFPNYTGVYMDQGVYKDTRCVDYLSLAGKTTDLRSISTFLMQSLDERFAFNSIKQIHPTETTQSLYRTTTLILNAALINWMSSIIGKAGVRFSYDLPANGFVAIENLMNMTQAAQFNPFFNTAPGGQYNSYGSPIYNY